ncbi:hypothetical protein [Kitasatospora purpeofusca]|uniref:hypothetical protein n=1 Tax=Kitasatospora purpeofusca TaxID=67352 RepID=UPI000ADDDF45|nr:hypothetical protein [Kitasatospora purpeofusca]
MVLADEADADLLLDAIDATLFLLPKSEVFGFGFSGFLEQLETVLTDGGSAFRIADDGRSLERRVDETVRDAVLLAGNSAASAPAGSASEHLRDAWQAVYGRTPNPPAAYSLAIKAVEAAAHAVLEPNNAKSTLGTMIRNLRDAPQNFRVAIDGPSEGDPTPVIGMLQMLWQGQTSRHGGQTPTRPETKEAAEMAVHLAATLVQWFTAGAVTRRT